MPEKQIPFYAQTAILDQYIHSSAPDNDREALEVILETLRSKPDIRSYFFRSGPNASWAPILWDNGFFETPPTPQKSESGYTLPRWDVQDYLISVADKAPEIVIKHINKIQGSGWYISEAIRALCNIPPQQAVDGVGQIVDWLKDPRIAFDIAPQVYELIVRFAKTRNPVAFPLFEALATPIIPPDGQSRNRLTGTEAVALYDALLDHKPWLEPGLDLLRELDSGKVLKVLEDSLILALALEAKASGKPDSEFSSWWRVAVEDTGQDSNSTYKDKILKALRDTLEFIIDQNPENAEAIVIRYLSESHSIIRRLGLHILSHYPNRYQVHVSRELGITSNLDDIAIHHEFFLLLQRGYNILTNQEQEALVAAICQGPTPESVESIASWAEQERNAEPAEYKERYSKLWTRDRLWMIKEYLTGHSKEVLDTLIREYKTPEHPEFTSWSSGGWIRDVSPFSEEELSSLSPEHLVELLKGWRPSPRHAFSTDEISFKGLATSVANLVLANVSKYAKHLTAICQCHPLFSSVMIDRFSKEKRIDAALWKIGLDLSEGLLSDNKVRTDSTRSFDGNWREARLSIVRLLQTGLQNPDNVIPPELAPTVLRLLFILIDDPDPDSESDRPGEGWFGHDDPVTVAINHVRSSALDALVNYSLYKARIDRKDLQSETKGPGPERLEAIVREQLTRKVNSTYEPSRAVHSIFGRYLPLLYWLDMHWVETQLDRIFPMGDDPESIGFFVAAWDSFVIFNQCHIDILQLLRPQYQRAILNLSKGVVTKTHLQPVGQFAIHLVWEYLLSNYDLHTPAGKESLVASAFEQVGADTRGSLAWAVWRVYSEDRLKSESYWSRIRSLWEWRTQEASTADHSIDFDQEMRHFAQLLPVVPKTENMASLWPLLEGLIPHLTRGDRHDYGWRAVEEYLVREVEHDSLRVIRFYQLLQDQMSRPEWFRADENERKIIETAVSQKESRNEALMLIDMLARRGDDRYRDIYERYAAK